ncbi:MAG: sugar phosphate isomerase/epimerase [Armatimonadetes bacterium]|nr:sugar phosphate isomerase/epimerase [Armatimonadota bacterium]
MSLPIALELYSVRNECAQDLLGVLAKVAKMGYQGVEFAGFHGHSAEAVKSALQSSGLQVAGSHTGIGVLGPDKLDETLAFMETIGCKYVIVPGIPEEKRNSPEACLATAEEFTALAETLEARGFRAGYHCHHGDIVPLSNGETAWYMIAEHTPDSFVMQYDTANGMSGGADPVQPILDFPGRGETVHLKEWAGAHGAALIGEGQVPWQQVFEACESVGGTRWYIVEHEDESLMPPMEAVDKCLQNLRRMGK